MPFDRLKPDIAQQLLDTMDREHADRRLALEENHQQRVVTWHRKFFHVENWYSLHGLIRTTLRLTGLHGRGQRNARTLRQTHNRIVSPRLPAAFDGFRILHLSDLHLDMDQQTAHAISDAVRTVEYDLCVLTGDYRANTFGDSERSMQLMANLRLHLPDPVMAVLGNHDSIHMVPALDSMGIQVLMNRTTTLERDGQRITIAGVDDGHYFRLHDIDKVRQATPEDHFSILLSHTPELYREAATAGFDVFFCGHTHGGQICLPGGIPVILESKCPRSLGRGTWQQDQMQGYTSVGASTSVVNVRFNCPPEITLHTLVSRQSTVDSQQ